MIDGRPTSTAPHRPPVARFDDLGPGGTSFELHDAADGGRADRLDQVLDALLAAERAAAAGRWVAVAVSYEAAAAFDDTLPTRRPPDKQPYVVWQSFLGRRPTARPRAAPLHPEGTVDRHGSSDGYRAGVDEIRRRIADGDVYQVNLTDRFEARGEVRDLYARLLAGQRCEYGAYLDVGGTAIACASPELFFRWDAATITCRPMKGTRARHPRPDVDVARAEALRTSAKDRAENVMIVDLLRNDLSKIAELGSVSVPRLFDVERYETVWQMTSTVSARPRAGTTLVDVFRAIFPCGSVTGAPKRAAMRIIGELEPRPRGVYCGAIGYLSPAGDEPRAVFCVPIRTAVAGPEGQLLYGAGAGITWPSDPVDEDAEVEAKVSVLRRPWHEFELLETLRLDDQGVHHAAEHLDRLVRSADWFGVPLERRAAAALLDALPASPTPTRVRLLADRAGRVRIDHGPLDPAPEQPLLAVDDRVTRSDDPFCCHKTTDREHYRQALARHPHADDVVLVNEWGHAVETTTCNLAYRIGDRWYTPPLADGGLAGIAREVALAAGTLTERSVAATDLGHCAELAVLNDLRGWRRAVLSRP